MKLYCCETTKVVEKLFGLKETGKWQQTVRISQLTDISSQNILNLFLLKTSFDNKLIVTVDRTTKTQDKINFFFILVYRKVLKVLKCYHRATKHRVT